MRKVPPLVSTESAEHDPRVACPDLKSKGVLDTIRVHLIEWGSGGRNYPWRTETTSAWELLVAEMLLKRTTAKAASRLYPSITRSYPTPTDLDLASEADVAEQLVSIGLQNQRARALKAAAAHIVEVHGGLVPDTLESLTRVPGVGDYTARAVLCYGFKRRTAPVDSNVVRVLRRLFYSHSVGWSESDSQMLADSLLPLSGVREYNLGLLDFSAAVCRPASPLCGSCSIRSMCDTAMNTEMTERETEERIRRLEFGRFLRSLRQAKGLGLARLAKVSGVSKNTVIRLEKGDRAAADFTLRKLAGPLGVAYAELREARDGRGKEHDNARQRGAVP